MKTPICYMMIGLPYSGKSTWVKQEVMRNKSYDYVILDTDTYISGRAEAMGISYNEAIKSEYDDSERLMYHKLHRALSANETIYWDQTNLTRKSRAHKLKLIPSHYDKVAIVFPMVSKEELAERRETRKNKYIGDKLLQNMAQSYQPPSYDEGFMNIVNL